METKFIRIKNIIFAIAGMLLLVVSVVPTFAQTTYTTPAKIKADTRKSKKEAVAYEAEHKETHLDVAPYNYKIGRAGRKPKMVDEEPTDYNNDKEKNALFESPKKINKKKKLLQAQKQE
ncbi:MAG: hypothetical protein ACO1OF_03505 [Adhaeribacter sp.]